MRNGSIKSHIKFALQIWQWRLLNHVASITFSVRDEPWEGEKYHREFPASYLEIPFIYDSFHRYGWGGGGDPGPGSA